MELSKIVRVTTFISGHEPKLTVSFVRFPDVHRYDAHAIPLEGPYGLISHAQRLLDTAAALDERGKADLLNRFKRVVRENQ